MKDKLNKVYVVINDDKTNAQILQNKPVDEVHYYEVETTLDFDNYVGLYKYSRKPLINKLTKQ